MLNQAGAPLTLLCVQNTNIDFSIRKHTHFLVLFTMKTNGRNYLCVMYRYVFSKNVACDRISNATTGLRANLGSASREMYYILL